MKSRYPDRATIDARKQACRFEPASARPRCETCAQRGPKADVCTPKGLYISRYSVCADWKPAAQAPEAVPNRSNSEAGAVAAAGASSAPTARFSGGRS